MNEAGMTGSQGILTGYLVAAAVTICCSAAAAPPDRDRRPNFVVILTDDQRADALGCAGNPHIRTPHIDALAGAGVRFTHAFVTTSICSPSRAALLTGRYGSANGVRGLSNAVLNAGEKTWPQALEDAGYRTAVIGKWHLKNPPASMGFAEAVCFESNGPYYGREVVEHGRQRVVQGHLEDYTCDQARRFLHDAGARSEPFALLLCTQLPHLDHRFRWDAKPESIRQYRADELPIPPSWTDDLAGKPPYLGNARHRTKAVDEYGYADKEKLQRHIRDYYATITDMDAAVGTVLQTVRDLNLNDNTYLVFTSDNGWFLGEHRFTSKVLAYEESIRVPLIVAGPGIQRRVDSRLVLNVDLAPTLLELAGLPQPAGLHGASLVPLLRGGRDLENAHWRTSILYEALQPELGSWPLLAVRTERWKYIQTLESDTDPPKPAFDELYDLSADPGETRNLASDKEHADTLRELQAELARHRREIRPAVPTTNPSIRIDAEFPGGNILVDRIDGDRAYLRPDLRDTTKWWFYWYFRVRGAAGRTLTFEFTGGNPIGVLGPAVSTDAGRTWSWMAAESVRNAGFTYAFPARADEVRFAYTIPYLEKNLQMFLRPLRNSPHLRIDSLASTSRGRPIEALYLGRIEGDPDFRVLLTARHHACETMANFVLEGIIQGILQDDEHQWLRDHVEFLVVPFVDKDGVEQGDQGKLRSPHDPNRDYAGESIYPAVAALRRQVPGWSGGRLRIALDLHCPYIRGKRNEVVYFVGIPVERIWQEVQRFSTILESLPPAGLPYRAQDNLPFGREWNTAANLAGGTTMAHWASEIPGVRVASTIEVPYANASGTVVTPDSARALGRDLCRAIRRYLDE